MNLHQKLFAIIVLALHFATNSPHAFAETDLIRAAVRLVEEGRYTEFSNFLITYPEILGYRDGETSLLCELTYIPEGFGSKEVPGFDLEAISIFLEVGGTIESCPTLIGSLISSANTGQTEAHIIEGEVFHCSSSRRPAFDMLGELLTTTEISRMITTGSGLQRSTSAFYIYLVCLSDHTCNDAFETRGLNGAVDVGIGLLPAEIEEILFLSRAGLLDSMCVSQFVD